MIRNTFSLYKSIIPKTPLTVEKILPSQLALELTDLFKRSRYNEVLNKIENSSYRNHPALMKLAAVSHDFLQKEHADACRRIEGQIKLFRKRGYFSEKLKEESLDDNNRINRGSNKHRSMRA